jgi:hypothetical protein
MPTHERPTHERSADGAKEKATEGTNEGRPFRPTAPTDLPDELLKMITGSGVKGDPGVRRRWLSTQTEKLVEEKKHEGSFCVAPRKRLDRGRRIFSRSHKKKVKTKRKRKRNPPPKKNKNKIKCRWWA